MDADDEPDDDSQLTAEQAGPWETVDGRAHVNVATGGELIIVCNYTIKQFH